MAGVGLAGKHGALLVSAVHSDSELRQGPPILTVDECACGQVSCMPTVLPQDQEHPRQRVKLAWMICTA